MIFLSGELTGFRKYPNIEQVFQKEFSNEDCHFVGTVLPVNHLHGFKTGPKGATLYNIQIWPEECVNPLSASIEYLGPGMGPIHEAMRINKS